MITRVIAVDCFAPPELSVDPEGTVAPGAALTYSLVLENSGGWPRGDVTVEK